MDTLDLIRKLYDENADPADLAQGLDEEHLAELRRLVEAKEAVDGLPPRRPSTASLEAIAAGAGKAPAKYRGRLSLIISPRFIQRFAAAAVVVMAVGIGYLTLEFPDLIVESVDTELSENESRLDESVSYEVGEDLRDADEPPSNKPSRSNIESAPASVHRFEADPVIESRERTGNLKSKDEFAGGTSLTEELYKRSDKESSKVFSYDLVDDSVRSMRAARHADYLQLTGRATLVDAIMAPDLDSVEWDDKLRFQTFYWQVQALGQRSPDDEWEEAVPLEGSFRNLEGARRDPAWLEAKSEK